MIPPETEIEVVAIKGTSAHKKIMTYAEALKIKKKKGFYYKFYQMGFSQYNNK